MTYKSRIKKDGKWNVTVLPFAIVILVIGFIGAASADIIEGKVTNSANNNPLEAVKVNLKSNPQILVYTDKNGKYKLDTDVTGIVKRPKVRWNSISLLLSLQNLGENVSVQIRNAKGALLGQINPALFDKDFKYPFKSYPQGLYMLSIKDDSKMVHYWICKLGKGEFLIRGTGKKIAAHAAFSEPTGNYVPAHTLVYSKAGFKEATKDVTGSQSNVNLSLEPVPYCGNGVLDVGEVCDGDSRPCNLIDPMKYASGDGDCNDKCTGYTLLNQCVNHPLVDLSTNANGENYRKAAEITGYAHFSILMQIRPGLIEGRFHEIIDSVYDAGGANGLAFSHITASGPNSTILHYNGKNRRLEDGDVMKVDIGCKYNGWCGDVTRTYPVNGKFSPRQREIYQLVLDAQKAAVAAWEPNNQSLSKMTRFVKDFYRKSPLRAKDNSGKERTMDYFFTHALCHYVGKNVHGQDLGFSSSEPVKIGRIFTIEPGLYIKSEGFGVRIEDDYIMTSEGPRNIFPNTPKEVDHIEAIMALRKLSPQPAEKVYEETNERSDHMDF